MDILNLHTLKPIKIQENDTDYLITAEETTTSIACTHCGVVDDYQRFGKKEHLFMDTPIHGKRVGILIERQRYRCKSCNGTFFANIEDLDSKRNCTNRLMAYIEKQSLTHTFVSIALTVGVDEKTVRNIFSDYIERLSKTVDFETPKLMGIDEIHIIKKPRCVITNIEQNTIIDILPDRNKTTVVQYLSAISKKQNIRLVTMDMWKPYKDAVDVVIPHADIIVDKFHVVRMANEALDRVRKDLRSSLTSKERRTLKDDRFILLKRHSKLDIHNDLILQSWTGRYNQLGQAYWLKERFFDLWDTASKERALQHYKEWKKDIPSELTYAFEPLTKAMSNWEQEIFGYFDHNVTNAYTESINNLIRVMNRLGRGYSFEALRAKILYSEGVHKVSKPKFRRDNFVAEKRAFYDNPFASNLSKQEPSKNYGTDISTLIQKIENGEL